MKKKDKLGDKQKGGVGGRKKLNFSSGASKRGGDVEGTTAN